MSDTAYKRNLRSRDAQPHPTHPTERAIVEAIHNTRRRYALYYLHNHDGAADLDDLVNQVADWEVSPTPGAVLDEKRRSVYSALQQTHLPYLEERSLVRWDRESNRVECQLRNATLDLLLANDPRTTIRWHRVYLLVSALAVLVTGLAWAGVGPFGMVSLAAVGAAILLVYVILSASYWYDVYRWHRRMEGMPPDFLITGDQSEPPDEPEEGDSGER